MGARRYELEVRQHLNGPKKYCVPGREPDTADTLESDGLIKQEGNDVVVLKPEDLRPLPAPAGRPKPSMPVAKRGPAAERGGRSPTSF